MLTDVGDYVNNSFALDFFFRALVAGKNVLGTSKWRQHLLIMISSIFAYVFVWQHACSNA